jgi:B12-binding domain/radical SAM domain protein
VNHQIAFVIYYLKQNKYSFNALVGALETQAFYGAVDTYFFTNKEDLEGGLDKIINNYKQIILGVSFFTTQLWDIHSLMKQFRKKYGDSILLIAGGPHPTGDPHGTLNIGFDIVIVGEGEETLIELLQCIKNQENLFDIKGIAYLNKEGIYNYTGKRQPINLDQYPPFPIEHSKFGAIEITRGCPYVCYFCQTPYILGTQPRHRSIESICKYIKIMKEKNLTDIRFITPNAFSYGSSDGKTLSLPHLENLLNKIKDIIAPDGRIFLGSFPSEVRPEHVTKETLGLIKKYCANDNIIIGAQSGSQDILDSCHRGHNLEDIYNSVKLTIEENLIANVDFIFGLPKETEKDINLTIKLMEDLVKLGARIHTHSFIPLPQTPFMNESPKRIDENIKLYIKKITSMGLAFGDWAKQERLSIKIAKYLKTRKIK